MPARYTFWLWGLLSSKGHLTHTLHTEDIPDKIKYNTNIVVSLGEGALEELAWVHR